METSTILRALEDQDGNEPYVYDIASEYGEPGYASEGPVVLGTYWCQRRDCNYPDRYDDGRRKVHSLEYHYPRMFAALEARGVALEWYDEWTVVDGRAYRTQADSYSWEPTAVFNEEICEYMVPDDGIELWIEWAINDPRRCLMSHTFSDDELAAEGFVERSCDYASGWFEGMDDDPEAIARTIHEREPGTDVLFKLSENSQFYSRFCVFVRTPDIDQFPDQ